MTCILISVNWIILIGTSLFLMVLSLSFFREKEIRAGVTALVSFILNSVFWGLLLTSMDTGQTLNIFIVSLLGLFGIISLIRFFPGRPKERDTSKAVQYDERDNMFARNNIQHHPELMKQYYALRPEKKSIDHQIHQKPEFGEKEQVFHDQYTVPGYQAAFEYLERSIPLSVGNVSEQKASIDPVQLCKTIRDLSIFYGACDVSFLRLKPHHYYSHKGRHAENWGSKTDQNHKTAIAIVVPMRVEMIKKAPTSSVLQESAQKYVEAAKISNILAGYIRNFGYPARAHNDANYDTLCVPIAVESGLGELGRMGIFMHRVFGPCVRLAIVTTDLELPDSVCPKPLYMENFCKICKKCADNCPSGSVSHGDEPYSRNLRHWSINQEKCFSYWKTIGSDCGLCISVCPYTKPDTIVHRFVRFYISRNVLNQKIALFMDDLLYGRHRKIARTNPVNIL
ncbi:MAG: 4Fe-4S dicluster domain-containing protein [Desulfobacula sp.]|jgi:reductive dehalogenase|uniref:4Fe-4S dicluster domain-containing protein n=1 Tax=Desulfobacula sp. TaxID=2593537 RepID=UPI001E145CD8|nr:4Fe-4S dicluster domain-containing protein [Desulfobacula sp.]MBT3484952.1 4Fe-4S dicluster domain-containing protein [Desulfobacula sp.]MBT3803212.1 4Fe-4S dicluster domain-containing protein [Desulfobacula sp.]MBT4024595.1 4Fe-4S dicluster domain-containing protein [Desulfobacula sp.]MBT4200267.1 4Fe-4S dicluster domain-containing protein [Desulfobacula sp.]